MERYTIFSFFASVLLRQPFTSRFGQDPLAVFPETFLKLEQHGLVEISQESIRLTDLGQQWRNEVFYAFYADAFKKGDA